MNSPLQPKQFDVVQGVFKRLARQPWFSRDIIRQQEFASYCLRTFQAGVTDPDRLYEACERAARERFAEPL
jgi:phosphoglycolate phosphatase-like HAD superfamily hydrolase